MLIARYCLLFTLVTLCGCGGGSAIVAGQNPPVVLAFDTSRIGIWSGNMHGPIMIVIQSDRKIIGFWQADAGTDWAIAGQTSDPTIRDNGVSLNFTSGNLAIYGTGILLVTRADHLTGNLSISGGGVQVTYPVDLVRQ